MGCGCGSGGAKARQIDYQVRFKDGHQEKFSSVAEAQAAIRQAKGGQMRAVPVSG